MCSLSKEQSILSRVTIQNAFFFLESCPFFDLDFFPLSSTLSRAPALACVGLVNSFPDKQIFAFSKLQAAVDNNFLFRWSKFLLKVKKKILRKGAYTGIHHFLLFLNPFPNDTL